MVNKQTVSTTHALSAALVALGLYAGVNGWIASSHMRFANQFASPNHGWSYWSVQAMHSVDPARINVVLLGSSLMVAAVAESDALYKNQALDLCSYRSAQYFDHQMRARTNLTYHTMNLATPGQVPSDAYLTLKTALANGIKPGIVLYGIAPRDFIDHTLNNAEDTEPFHYLSRIVPIQDAEVYTSPMAKIDQKLRASIQLYNDSPDIIASAQERLGGLVESVDRALFGKTDNGHMLQYSVHQFVPDYPNANIVPGSSMAQVPSPDRPFNDNTDDYRCRYKFPNQHNYQVQMHFLDRLIALCQSNDIAIVLVNMPITEGNMNILEPSWRQRYFADVDKIVQLRSVPFLDQCQFEAYQHDDFRDTVHLNGFGGKKFTDLLVERLAAGGDTHRLLVSAANRPQISESNRRSTDL